jgi:hypothetical protein
MTLEGHYPIILACNGKPKIHLDQDSDAWIRRLVILNLKTPSHDQHYGKMAEMILKEESSGILNWLLEGRAKLVKDKHQLTQTPEQKARTVNLLLGSDSPAALMTRPDTSSVDGWSVVPYRASLACCPTSMSIALTTRWAESWRTVARSSSGRPKPKVACGLQYFVIPPVM